MEGQSLEKLNPTYLLNCEHLYPSHFLDPPPFNLPNTDRGKTVALLKGTL